MNRNRLQGGRGCPNRERGASRNAHRAYCPAPPPLPSAVSPYGTYPYAPLPKRRNIGLLVVVVILIVIVVVVALAAIVYVMTSGLASGSKPVVTFSNVMKQNAVTWTIAIASASPAVAPSNYKLNFGIGTTTGTAVKMGANDVITTVTVTGATPSSVGVKWTDLGGTGTVKGGDVLTFAFLYSDGSQIQSKSWQA